MNGLYMIFTIMAPLLLVSIGALISEYAGRLAMFMECMINLGAFLCFAFTILCKNVFLGIVGAILICVALTAVLGKAAERFKANMFLASLSMNLLFSAITTLLSALIFKTRGVLYSPYFEFSAKTARAITSIFCYAFSLSFLLILRYTRTGLIMRISGSSADMLTAQGRNPKSYHLAAWLIAAFCASFCGCTLSIRLSSYVPGLASGRGWTALAAVFLCKKNPRLIILSAFVFALAEYAGTVLPGFTPFSAMPSFVFLSLPSVLALLLIALSPH